MECCLDCLLLLLAVEVWNLEVVVVELKGHCHCLDYCRGGPPPGGRPPPEPLGPAAPLGCALCIGLVTCSDPVPPPEPSGGPPPPDVLGLVLRGVHCLAYVNGLTVALLGCMGAGGGGGGGILRDGTRPGGEPNLEFVLCLGHILYWLDML